MIFTLSNAIGELGNAQLVEGFLIGFDEIHIRAANSLCGWRSHG
jgi:hypothetical protein